MLSNFEEYFTSFQNDFRRKGLPDNSQIFFPPQKWAAHGVSNHKLCITGQKYKLVHLPARFSGFHHVHTASSSRLLLLEWSMGTAMMMSIPPLQTEIQKHCVSDYNLFGWRNKASKILSSSRMLCPNLKGSKHLLHFANSLLWVWRRPIIYMGKICRNHKVNVYPVFEHLIHPSKRSSIFWPTALGSSYPEVAELKLILVKRCPAWKQHSYLQREITCKAMAE